MYKAETKDKILNAGIILFSKYGYDQVSLREIAFEAGVTANILRYHFSDKEELMDGIFDYIQSEMEHYAPSSEELEEQFKVLSPKEILTKFVENYHISNDFLMMHLYKLMFMVRYKDEKLKNLVNDYLLIQPITNLKNAIDFLIEKKAVPACDSRAIAEIWNRTALVYAMIYTHLEIDNQEGYENTIEFIIDMVVKGVDVIPKEKLTVNWEGREVWDEIHIDKISTKGKIMYEALDLFSEQGYNNVSLKSIAQRADISVPSVYRYYRSKKEIMSDITKHLTNKYNRFTINNPVFIAVLNEYKHGEILLYLSGSYPPLREEKALKLYRILFREQYFNDEIKDLFLSSIFRDCETVSKNLQELVDAGRLKPCDSEKLGIIYVYSMRSLTICQALGEVFQPEEKNMRERITFIAASMAIRGYLNQ